MLACEEMGKEVVVSIGRVLADQIHVDPPEAFAIIDQLWRRLQASLDDSVAMMPFPRLDAIGITPMGDFELRTPAGQCARVAAPPHRVAHDLGDLLLRLLTSGRPDMGSVPAACIDAARRASSTGAATADLRAVVTPDALLAAL